MSSVYNGTIYESLTVDVSMQNSFAPPLVKQGDAYTRGFDITLTDGGEKLTIPQENTTVWFNCRNQTDSVKRASIEGTVNTNGTVTVKVPSVVMEAAGFIQCDISIITAENNETHVLKSTLFYLTCEAAANPKGTTSQAEDSILAGLAAGTVTLPGNVPKTRTVAGLGLEDDIDSPDLARALSDDMYDELELDDYAYRAHDTPSSNRHDLQSGQTYYDSTRGRIGVKISEASPSDSGLRCIETYDTDTIDDLVDDKVDKVTGKGLSTNDYTTAEKNKLGGIEAQANKTVVDSALSASSTNPVQNKAVKTALDTKEAASNKTTEISESSTDAQYPSALAVKKYVDGMLNEALGDLEAILAEV